MINIKDIKPKNTKVAILGLGKSGVSSSKLAKHLGFNIFLSDSSKNIDIANLNGFEFEIGLHSSKILESDLIIKSPGIPNNINILKAAVNKKIPIISEIEFASWFSLSPIIGLTGTNGKTTTVNLLHKIFLKAGFDSMIGGNVGIPFSASVLEEIKYPDPKIIHILEISSFQMEFIKHFHPNIAIYTNISPDHLDRHHTMDEYTTMKMMMIKNQTVNDFIVYNIDDPSLSMALKNSPATLVPFSTVRSDMYFKIKTNSIYENNGNPLIGLEDIVLPGNHNLSNILAASTAAQLIGIPNNQIIEIMKTFQGVEHRLEYVSEINNVQYINDSKATNIDAVIVALDSFDKPLILILGGRNKGTDFRLLLPHIKSSQVRLIISYGESGGEIVNALGDAVRSVQVNDLKCAITSAQSQAIPGDIVLLSPGCASYDQFKNYKTRGIKFKTWVTELEKKND